MYYDTLSENAMTAYENGEMPRSAWSKNCMLSAIYAIIDSENLRIPKEPFKAMTQCKLFDLFFIKTSQHHTGAYFAYTPFYSVDAAFIRTLNKDKLYALYTEQRKRKDSSIHSGRRFVEVLHPDYKASKDAHDPIIRRARGYIKGDYFTALDGTRTHIYSKHFEVLTDISSANLYEEDFNLF